MTELLTRLQGLNKSEGHSCPVARLIESLDTETQEVVERVLADKSYSHSRLHSELRASGFSLAKTSLALHRNRIMGKTDEPFCTCQTKETK